MSSVGYFCMERNKSYKRVESKENPVVELSRFSFEICSCNLHLLPQYYFHWSCQLINYRQHALILVLHAGELEDHI